MIVPRQHLLVFRLDPKQFGLERFSVRNKLHCGTNYLFFVFRPREFVPNLLTSIDLFIGYPVIVQYFFEGSERRPELRMSPGQPAIEVRQSISKLFCFDSLSQLPYGITITVSDMRKPFPRILLWVCRIEISVPEASYDCAYLFKLRVKSAFERSQLRADRERDNLVVTLLLAFIELHRRTDCQKRRQNSYSTGNQSLKIINYVSPSASTALVIDHPRLSYEDGRQQDRNQYPTKQNQHLLFVPFRHRFPRATDCRTAEKSAKRLEYRYIMLGSELSHEVNDSWQLGHYGIDYLVNFFFPRYPNGLPWRMQEIKLKFPLFKMPVTSLQLPLNPTDLIGQQSRKQVVRLSKLLTIEQLDQIIKTTLQHIDPLINKGFLPFKGVLRVNFGVGNNKITKRGLERADARIKRSLDQTSRLLSLNFQSLDVMLRSKAIRHTHLNNSTYACCNGENAPDEALEIVEPLSPRVASRHRCRERTKNLLPIPLRDRSSFDEAEKQDPADRQQQDYKNQPPNCGLDTHSFGHNSHSKTHVCLTCQLSMNQHCVVVYLGCKYDS